MRQSIRGLAVALGAVAVWGGSARAVTYTFTAGGVYDNANNANKVDTNASGSAVTATGATDVAGFTANVATAFAANRGGVIDFDSGGGSAISATNDAIRFTYGGGAKSFTVTSSRDVRTATYGSATPISSNTQFDLPDAVEGTQTLTLTFGGIVGGDPGEIISAIALTANSRNSVASTVSMNVGLSDGSSSSVLSHALATTAGADDTFYGFVAPDGLGITSLTITRTGRVPFDDLGFITTAPTPAPEPGVVGVLGAGMVGVMGRRRWRVGADRRGR
jgi:hypothetical protein